MVNHIMKTTLEISNHLFEEAKRFAAKKDKTFREVVEMALRLFLKQQKADSKKPFKLRDGSFKGNGLVEGLQEGDWETIRSLIYEGRGG